jgi:hypothetical protein
MKKLFICSACISATFALANFAHATPFNLSSASATAQTLALGETGTITSAGSLTLGGSTVAVTITGNNATLTNLGTISQTGTGRDLRDNTGVTGLIVTNGSSTNSTALMQTADADVIQMNKAAASVTLNNYGTMTSLNASAGGAQAVDFNAITSGANTVNNYATGVMQASEADAVRPGVNGVINNDGLIKSTTTTGSSSDGVDAQSNSGITITNGNAFNGETGTSTATIEGGRHGITGGNTATDSNGNPTVNNGAFAMSITNNLGGTIQGDNGSGINIDGLNGNELVTIVNHGTITGNGHDIGDGLGHDGDGVDVDGLVNVTNTGTIRSINAYGGPAVNGVQPIEFSEGVTVGGGTITNSGTIEGSVASGNLTAVGRGITIAGVDKLLTTNAGVVTETAIPVQAPYAATTITNSGLIKGDSDSGIIFSSALSSGFSHTITNQAGGTIDTGSTTAPAILTAADPVTINNSGTIDGSSSGKAITGGAAALTVNIVGGSASVLGDIAGGTGSSLSIDPGAGQSFSYAGAISNFASAEIKSGTVTFSGASTYAGATTVSGGRFVVNGSITSATTVKSGATLGGNGSVGAINIQASGTLAPGNLTGPSATFTGSASIYETAIGSSGTVSTLSLHGDHYAQTVLTGTSAAAETALSLDSANSVLRLDLSGSLHSGSYNPASANPTLDNYFVFALSDSADTISGHFAYATLDGTTLVAINYSASNAFGGVNGLGSFTLGGQEFAISYQGDSATNSTLGGNDVAITAITAVATPEPASAALLLGGGALLLNVRRRRTA